MPALTPASDTPAAPASLGSWMLAHSTAVFIALATLILGAIAWVAASDIALSPPNKDIWQHAAALRSLMADLGDPANPFVLSDAPSRHFHPLWVACAAIGSALGLTVWHVLAGFSFVSMGLLGLGIYIFARAYFTAPLAPALLLLVMLFGWSIGLEHTGFHNIHTLLYGAAFPASTMIGLCLILWAVTIRALARPALILVIVPLAALMFATHQLGAVICFIGAACFALLWPYGTVASRAIALFGGVAGVGLSLLWPYYNPLLLVLEPGNSSWTGGPNFYGPTYLIGAFVPAAFGCLGLRDARARPLVLALAIYAVAFLFGLTGAQVAGRFLMPMVLVLHIGLTGLILRAFQNPDLSGARKRTLTAAAVVFIAVSGGTAFLTADASKIDAGAATTAPFAAAVALTQTIPDTLAVAAFGDTAWPVVATGQPVLSVPWPEPGIPDLAARQAATRQLFDPALSAPARRALAQQHEIATLFIDARMLDAPTRQIFEAQAATTTQAGTLLRFDLFN